MRHSRLIVQLSSLNNLYNRAAPFITLECMECFDHYVTLPSPDVDPVTGEVGSVVES